MIDLKEALEPFRKKERAAWQTAYLRDQFSFLGVERPIHQKVCRQVFSRWDIESFEEKIEALWSCQEREFHYAAIDWALFAKKRWKEAHLALFEKMLRTHSWWDTVDPIAAHLVGGLVKTYPSLVSQMDRWIEEENFWIRRTALLFQLRFKKETDADRLFSYCLKCASSKEFFIRKAIGWALREYAKSCPKEVLSFLSKYHMVLSPLSVREAKRRLLNKTPD